MVKIKNGEIVEDDEETSQNVEHLQPKHSQLPPDIQTLEEVNSSYPSFIVFGRKIPAALLPVLSILLIILFGWKGFLFSLILCTCACCLDQRTSRIWLQPAHELPLTQQDNDSRRRGIISLRGIYSLVYNFL